MYELYADIGTVRRMKRQRLCWLSYVDRKDENMQLWKWKYSMQSPTVEEQEQDFHFAKGISMKTKNKIIKKFKALIFRV